MESEKCVLDLTFEHNTGKALDGKRPRSESPQIEQNIPLQPGPGEQQFLQDQILILKDQLLGFWEQHKVLVSTVQELRTDNDILKVEIQRQAYLIQDLKQQNTISSQTTTRIQQKSQPPKIIQPSIPKTPTIHEPISELFTDSD